MAADKFTYTGVVLFFPNDQPKFAWAPLDGPEGVRKYLTNAGIDPQAGLRADGLRGNHRMVRVEFGKWRLSKKGNPNTNYGYVFMRSAKCKFRYHRGKPPVAGFVFDIYSRYGDEVSHVAL